MKTELRSHLRQSCLELKEILVLRWKIFFLTNSNNLMDDKGVGEIQTPGGKQKIVIINVLYQLLKKHGVLPMIERDEQEAGH